MNIIQSKKVGYIGIRTYFDILWSGYTSAFFIQTCQYPGDVPLLYIKLGIGNHGIVDRDRIILIWPIHETKTVLPWYLVRTYVTKNDSQGKVTYIQVVPR